jgi:hypothetical protein
MSEGYLADQQLVEEFTIQRGVVGFVRFWRSSIRCAANTRRKQSECEESRDS